MMPTSERYLISEIAESPRIGRSAISSPLSARTLVTSIDDAGAEARRETGADLEAEQAAAEQRVLVAAVGDRRGHRVDERLRETLGTLRDEHLLGAVFAERRGELLRDVLAEQDRVRLAAELGGELGALGDGAE